MIKFAEKMAVKSKILSFLTKNFDDPETGKRSPVSIAAWAAFCLMLYAYFLSFSMIAIFEPLYWDESQWVWVSQRYFGYLIKGDLKNPDWDQTFSYFGRDNPKIAQYLIAVPLCLSGELKTTFSAMEWDWEKGLDWNIRHGHSPPFRTLFYSRLLMPFLGAGCGLLFLFILSRVINWFSSLIGALFLGVHQLTVEYSSRAMQDLPAFFFCLLFLALVMSFNLRQALDKSPLKALLFALLSGVCLGLAIGTKLINLPLVGVWGLYLLWVTMFEYSPDFKLKIKGLGKLTLLGAASLLAAVLVFWASNPYLYSRSPLAAFEKSKVLFQLGAKVRKDRLNYPQYAINSNSEKLKILDQALVLEGFSPKKFGLSRKINFRAELYKYQGSEFAVAFIGAAALVIILIAGFLQRSPKLDLMVFLTLAMILIFSANFFWITLNWNRFFLPFLVPGGVLAAFAAELFIRPVLLLINGRSNLQLRKG